MNDQNRNLILATVLSFVVILAWYFLFPPADQTVTDTGAQVTEQVTSDTAAQTATGPVADAPADTATDVATTAPEAHDEAPRVKIETPRVTGSILLLGGRIDSLSLNDYRETLEPDSPNVTLLTPVGQPEAYYALYSWAPGGSLEFGDVPGSETPWQLEAGSNQVLTPETPVTLVWQNDKGLTFRRGISVDENFMFTVTQSVANSGESSVRLAASNQVVRDGKPSNLTRLLVHEGAIRQSGTELKEISFKSSMLKTKFDEMDPDPRWGEFADVAKVEGNGWLGFTDHYWMTVMIPAADASFDAVVQYDEGADIYRTVARYPTIEVAPGGSAEVTSRLFAGAKEWETIRTYERDSGIYHFIDSTDWGLFFFFTKPMFWLLHNLHSIIGNMGWSIIALTLVIKAIVLPLAYKSYVSMARMKELQPEIELLKERAGEDRQKLQKEMMELYKKNKVNPASGCLPIVVQIPIFFSLYKVILVTLELRHAPWIGWIQDLSSPDPSSILNLFGLLPYATPDATSIFHVISLGVLPILLGVSMWLQQKLNPTPTDATQAAIFTWMPWIFMFMLGRFASGLVLYWIANNTITFIQQYSIMTMHGKRPDLFGNIRTSFSRNKKPAGE